MLPLPSSVFPLADALFFLLEVVEIQGIFGRFSPGTGWGAVVVVGIVVVVVPVVVVVAVVVVGMSKKEYVIIGYLKGTILNLYKEMYNCSSWIWNMYLCPCKYHPGYWKIYRRMMVRWVYYYTRLTQNNSNQPDCPINQYHWCSVGPMHLQPFCK